MAADYADLMKLNSVLDNINAYSLTNKKSGGRTGVTGQLTNSFNENQQLLTEAALSLHNESDKKKAFEDKLKSLTQNSESSVSSSNKNTSGMVIEISDAALEKIREHIKLSSEDIEKTGSSEYSNSISLEKFSKAAIEAYTNTPSKQAFMEKINTLREQAAAQNSQSTAQENTDAESETVENEENTSDKEVASGVTQSDLDLLMKSHLKA